MESGKELIFQGVQGFFFAFNVTNLRILCDKITETLCFNVTKLRWVVVDNYKCDKHY